MRFLEFMAESVTFSATKAVPHEKYGTIDEFMSDSPEMNVSNGNAMAIQRMLGLVPDYGGTIKHEDIPNILRTLMRLKNSDTSQHTQAPSKTGGEMGRYKDDDGMDRIGKSATMHDAGRSNDQVNLYIDRLFEILTFAQKNEGDLSWG